MALLDSLGLCSESLVHRSAKPEHLPSTPSASSEGPAPSTTGQGSASESPLPTPPSVEIEQNHLSGFDLPVDVVDVILAARSPSSKSVHFGCWAKFVA